TGSGGDHEAITVSGGDGLDGSAGVNVGIQGGSVGAQIVDHFIAVGIPLRITGERASGQTAVAGRGEQGQAVVVLRPRPDRIFGSFQDRGVQALAGEVVGGSETGLAAADDHRVICVFACHNIS